MKLTITETDSIPGFRFVAELTNQKSEPISVYGNSWSECVRLIQYFRRLRNES